MRWFIVSEEELEVLMRAVWRDSANYYGIELTKPHQNQEREKAEAACRARPVPEWATHWYAEEITDTGLNTTISEIRK